MLNKKTIRIISIIIAIALLITMVAGGLISMMSMRASAASVSELKSKISSIDQQKKEIKNTLDSLDSKISNTTQKIQIITDQIALTKDDIDATEEVIKKLENQIEKKEQEIVVAQEKLDKQTKLFETRMRVMYENGNEIGYLDVVLGSKSFSDMLSRIEIVSEIMESDKKIVSDYKQAKTELETAKAQLESNQADQKKYKSSLESKYNDLDSQKTSLAESKKSLENDKAKGEEEYNELVAQQDKINSEIEELSRKAAEEAKKKQQASGGGSTTSNISSNGALSAVSVWPAPQGKAGSGYGWRTHPIYGTRKFHKGTDIPAPAGSPVLASGAGTVIKSYYSSSYGNYIVIDHGGGVMTGYAHMTRRIASVGDKVSAGQQIGTVGTTGNSTGNHLHFEVYINGSTVNPMNYF